MAPHAVDGHDSSERSFDYDLIAIGAGSAGTRTARKIASWGGKTAVVELPLHNDKYNSTIQLGGVGGGCVLRGCVPKKLLQRASDMAQTFEDAHAFGWEIDPQHLPRHNWHKLIEAQREVVHSLSKKWEAKLANAGVEILWGWGSIKGPHTVAVANKSEGTKEYTAKNIVICAGSRPASLPIPGAELCINYNEALALPSCPKKIAIVGAASPLGMALAGTFAGFGCEVHVVCEDELPLGPGVDKEVAAFCLEQYKLRGYTMHMCHEVVEVRGICHPNGHGAQQQQDGNCTKDAAANGKQAATARPQLDAGEGGQKDQQKQQQERSGSTASAAAAEEGVAEGSGGGGPGAAEDAGDDDLVTSTGVAAAPEAYASDDPKITSVSTNKDTQTVCDKGPRSLALRAINTNLSNNGNADSKADEGKGAGGDAAGDGAGDEPGDAADGVQWLRDLDYVIMDVGRLPHSQDLGLEQAGVITGEAGRVLVDKYLRTNVPSIWAAGEVTGRMMYQTAARMEGHALARTLWLNQPTPPSYWAMPMPIWSTPQGATVGLTEEEAAEQLDNAAIYTSVVTPLAAAVTGSKRPVFIKLIVDMDTDVVKGLSMIGDGTIEIVQGFAVCVKAGVTKTQLDGTVGMHPTLAEEVVTMGKPARVVGRKADKPMPKEARCIDD